MILGRAVLGTLRAVLGAITPTRAAVVNEEVPSLERGAGYIHRYVPQPRPQDIPVSVSAIAYPSGVGIRVLVGGARASGSAEVPAFGVTMGAAVGRVRASGSGQAIPAGVFAAVVVGKAVAGSRQDAVDVAWSDLQGAFAEDEDELLFMLGAFD